MASNNKNFVFYYMVQFLGAMNDNVFKNALVMLITYKSYQMMGLPASLLVPLAGGIFIFPFFLFSSIAGEIGDAYPRHFLIKLVKVFELLVMGVGSLGLFFESLPVLFISLFMMGLQSTLFGPLKYGSLPSLVKSEKLVFANALVSAGTFAAILLGTILGGFLSSLMAYQMILCFCILGLSFLGLLCALKIHDFDQLRQTQKEIHWNLFSSTYKMMKEVMGLGEEKWMILGMSWFWFVGSVILSVLPLIVKEVLYGNTLVATLFLGIFTIGMGLGAMASERFSQGKSEMGLVANSSILMSIFFLDLGFMMAKGLEFAPFELMDIALFYHSPTNWRVSFDFFMISFCGGLFMIPQMVRLQEVADPRRLSRYIAANNIFNALFMVSAALFVMFLSSYGYEFIFFSLSLFCFLAALVFQSRYSVFTIRLTLMFIARILYRIQTIGFEKIPRQGRGIILSNHQSFADWLVLMGTFPRPIQFVIDWRYYYLKGLHFWLKQARLIPIATRKEDPEILEKAFKRISDELQKGICLGVFPEGRLTRDGKIHRFQPGILKVLKKDPTPVILIRIEGLWGSILSHEGGKVFFKIPKTIRRSVKLEVLKVYEPNEFDLKEAEKIMVGDQDGL